MRTRLTPWRRRSLIMLAALLLAVLLTVAVNYFSHVTVDVLEPQGAIASQERNLIIFTLTLALIVVVPVFFMLFWFAWRYREGNHRARYAPDWHENKWLELLWWGIPCLIIGVLGTRAWQTAHALDPFQPLNSAVKPLRIQVVALQWRWLFIYPDQGIATINELRFPQQTPLNFEITSDAPMNSFWIPSLGTQVYAMSGMSMKLHLIADHTGDYKGSSTNISGAGYADMAFTAHAMTTQQFTDWAAHVKATAGTLTMARYTTLATPHDDRSQQEFVLGDPSLYTGVMMKYMMPTNTSQSTGGQ